MERPSRGLGPSMASGGESSLFLLEFLCNCFVHLKQLESCPVSET